MVSCGAATRPKSPLLRPSNTTGYRFGAFETGASQLQVAMMDYDTVPAPVQFHFTYFEYNTQVDTTALATAKFTHNRPPP